MLGLVLTAAIVAALVVVHEIGHYLAGLAIGIPPSSMAIELGFPVSRVTLRERGGRQDPGDHAAFRRLTRTKRRAFAFVAGGIALQTAAGTGAAAVVAAFASTHRLAERIVWASLLLLLGYLMLDILLTRRIGRPQGDASVLWGVSRGGTLACLAAVGAAHAAVLTLLG